MEKRNVYQMVTDKIISEMEKGIIPWQQPWSGSNHGAINYVTRKPYSPLNQWLLGRDGEFLTWKQVKNLGGNVKRGAKASMVVFFTTITHWDRKETDEEGNEEITHVVKEHNIPILRYYNVFHISDCEGIKTKIDINNPVTLEPIKAAENIINGYLSREKDLKFVNDKISNKAYYSPSMDLVQVPSMEQYQIIEEYYSTAFHEFIHSTMIESRCNRKSEQRNAAFGSEEYSREELVAEIGSAMLSNIAGLDNKKAFRNSVAYIQGWLKALKSDNRAIVWAASRAEKAAKYITGEQS